MEIARTRECGRTDLPLTCCLVEGRTPSDAPRLSQGRPSQVVFHSTNCSERYAAGRAFGKRAYASLLLNCGFQQEKNVLVIQYERETAEVATCEQRDWGR
jgi:hypothetical protein